MKVRYGLGLLCALGLAGCYQQAGDSFETINSSAVLEIPATPVGVAPGTDATPIIIVPDGGATPAPEEVLQLQVTAAALPSREELVTLPPVDARPPATPTVIIIIPAEETPTPRIVDTDGLLPTATPPAFITPQVPSQLVIATATPLGQPLTADPPTNGIITPTQFMPPVVEGCDYTIVRGDTLFRIALRNDVTLAALLSANNLSETSIIQPGQVIQIPGCNVTPTAVPAAVDVPAGPNAAPATLEANDPGTPQPGAAGTQTVHRVAPGDTLFEIAVRYGVTVRAIINANNLTNPDRLSIGQELVIPGD